MRRLLLTLLVTVAHTGAGGLVDGDRRRAFRWWLPSSHPDSSTRLMDPARVPVIGVGR